MTGDRSIPPQPPMSDEMAGRYMQTIAPKAQQTTYVKAAPGAYAQRDVTVIPSGNDAAVYETHPDDGSVLHTFTGPAAKAYEYAQVVHDRMTSNGWVILRHVP